MRKPRRTNASKKRGGRRPGAGSSHPKNTAPLKHGLRSREFRTWLSEARARCLAARKELAEKRDPLSIAAVARVLSDDATLVESIIDLLDEMLGHLDADGQLNGATFKIWLDDYIRTLNTLARIRATQAALIAKPTSYELSKIDSVGLTDGQLREKTIDALLADPTCRDILRQKLKGGK